MEKRLRSKMRLGGAKLCAGKVVRTEVRVLRRGKELIRKARTINRRRSGRRTRRRQ